MDEFSKGGGQNRRATVGYEVLPTLSGRCVETPGRLAYASCLAAASSRRIKELRLVRPWLLLRTTLEGDQGEFLFSRIVEIRRVLETLSHRILNPPIHT